MRQLPMWIICGLTLSLSCAALAQEARDWTNPMSADHPGFSDASATVSPGAFQAEIGFETTFGDTTTGALNLLTRAGLVNALELRAEIPAWTLPLEDGQEMMVDLVEVGLKWQCVRSDAWSLAVLPTVLIPTGAKNSIYGDVSGSVSLIADIPLTSALTVTTSVTPRWLRVDAASKVENQFDASFAAGLGWSATRSFGLYVEGWGVVTKEDDGYEVHPAGDVVLTYLMTPNAMLDVYGGVQWVAKKVTPYAGMGLGFRL